MIVKQPRDVRGIKNITRCFRIKDRLVRVVVIDSTLLAEPLTSLQRFNKQALTLWVVPNSQKKKRK
jgi:hypothetical protein